jgi:hypothetical protein
MLPAYIEGAFEGMTPEEDNEHSSRGFGSAMTSKRFPARSAARMFLAT